MRPVLLALATLFILPLAGCDETTDLGADISLLVDDAVAARQSGDYAQAVRLLEGAFDREPNNAEVRVELATTLLQRDGIDLLDLDRVGQFLSGVAGAGAAPASGTAGKGGCAAASDPTATAFDPTGVTGFADLVAHAETIARAGELLGAVTPAALQDFDICSSIADGALVYDRDGALAALAAQGLSEAQVAQALAVNALARFLDAYLFVTTELSQQATWYRLADGSVTICADDQEAFEAEARAAVEDIGEAVLSLDARASLLGPGSVAAEIVGVALDAYHEVRSAVADYCASA